MNRDELIIKIKSIAKQSLANRQKADIAAVEYDELTKFPELKTDAPSPEDPALSDADQEYLNTLENLKNKAKEMGDEKLENQIDNTITYFTRQHVVKEGDTIKKAIKIMLELKLPNV